MVESLLFKGVGAGEKKTEPVKTDWLRNSGCDADFGRPLCLCSITAFLAVVLRSEADWTTFEFSRSN